MSIESTESISDINMSFTQTKDIVKIVQDTYAGYEESAELTQQST